MIIHELTITLGTQINVRVQLGIRGGHFGKNNKCTGPNKHTGWKKLAEVIIDVRVLISLGVLLV